VKFIVPCNYLPIDFDVPSYFVLYNDVNFFFGSNDESRYRVIKILKTELQFHEMKLVA